MRSSGHLKPFDDSPGTASDTSLPGTVRVPLKGESRAVRPTGTAPGCQVTVARPSTVSRFPATPRVTVCVAIETGGSGAATTIPVAAVVAEAEPPAPVAVTP